MRKSVYDICWFVDSILDEYDRCTFIHLVARTFFDFH